MHPSLLQQCCPTAAYRSAWRAHRLKASVESLSRLRFLDRIRNHGSDPSRCSWLNSFWARVNPCPPRAVNGQRIGRPYWARLMFPWACNTCAAKSSDRPHAQNALACRPAPVSKSTVCSVCKYIGCARLGRPNLGVRIMRFSNRPWLIFLGRGDQTAGPLRHPWDPPAFTGQPPDIFPIRFLRIAVTRLLSAALGFASTGSRHADIPPFDQPLLLQR